MTKEEFDTVDIHCWYDYEEDEIYYVCLLHTGHSGPCQYYEYPDFLKEEDKINDE